MATFWSLLFWHLVSNVLDCVEVHGDMIEGLGWFNFLPWLQPLLWCHASVCLSHSYLNLSFWSLYCFVRSVATVLSLTIINLDLISLKVTTLNGWCFIATCSFYHIQHLNTEWRLQKREEHSAFHHSLLLLLKDCQAGLAMMNGWTVIPTHDLRRLNKLMTIIDSGQR